MKKLIIMCFTVLLAVALWPHHGKANTGGALLNASIPGDDSTKAAKKSKHKVAVKENSAKSGDTVHIDLTTATKKEEVVNAAPATKEESDKTASKSTAKTTTKASTATESKSSSKEPVATATTPSKKGKEAPVASTEGTSEVISLYNSLPLEDLPELQKYAGEKKYKDDADYRKSWIKTKDETRGFIVLQLPATDRYTKIQLFKTSDDAPVFVVETNDCSHACANFIRVYRQDAGAWVDVTEETMPKLDSKFMTGKLKQAYKKQYDDLDIYKTKEYENDENLQKALIYDISPDQKKIVVREQYLPLNLYDITWDGKSKFVLKKLGE